ncbi:pyridoxal-phosphate dependent enzyme [Fragilaria crotonensis]|nr:pyridoxal-phosphate dependent enzyme [Fragilaria crotonensis]
MFTTVLVRRSAAVVARRRSNVLPNATRSFSAHDDSSKADNEAVVPSPAVDERERDRIIRDNLPVTFADISRAHVAIRDGVVRTKCEKSVFLSEIIGANIYLKPEFRQFTGSFKERGARNAILKLKNRDPASAQRGVIAASAGNHALALAYHGRELGIPVTVVMPTVAPLAKVDKCRKFGARIIIEGMHIGEAKTYAETLVQSEGLTYVNGYDDPPIIAGAGTIGIELIDDVPNVDIVVVPVGGAGLIAGIACSVKTLKPEARVIGVEPEFCASYIGALKAGKPVQVPMTPTLADGLAVPMVGPHAFEVARHYVDECVTCTEKEISLAVLRLIEQEKMVVEGGGASGLAALLPGGKLDRPDMKGKNIVVPLCGGNIDTTVLGRVLDRGLSADNRLCNFYATVSDRPGGISRLTALLADEGASIKDIYHERAWLYQSVDQVQVKCVVELNGPEHAKRLKQALLEKGYPLIWDTKV